jgi:hypothetical protein
MQVVAADLISVAVRQIQPLHPESVIIAPGMSTLAAWVRRVTRRPRRRRPALRPSSCLAPSPLHCSALPGGVTWVAKHRHDSHPIHGPGSRACVGRRELSLPLGHFITREQRKVNRHTLLNIQHTNGSKNKDP